MSEKCTCKICGTTIDSTPIMISHKGGKAYLCEECAWEVSSNGVMQIFFRDFRMEPPKIVFKL